MDAPIYIYFSLFPDYSDSHHKTAQNHLIVVQEGDISASTVQTLNLPNSGRGSFPNSGLAVTKSRLFLVGGSYFDYSRVVKYNEILSVNVDGVGSASWETNPLGDDPTLLSFVGGTAVSNDGGLIYWIGLGGDLLAIDPKTRALKFTISGATSGVHPYLLAVTDTKVYVNCVFTFCEDKSGFSSLGYYDIKSQTWHAISDKARLHHVRNKVVVIRDSYLINFSLLHPTTGKFYPALYVYDIRQGAWLTEPVKGLPNDGYTLPSLKVSESESLCFGNPSLMQVNRRDELKLALVWCYTDYEDNNVVHFSRFILDIQDSDGSPIFEAKNLWSFKPYSANGLVLRVEGMPGCI